jgi:hypothetical protein
MIMERSCTNCGHGQWLNGKTKIAETCLKCKYVDIDGDIRPSNWIPKVQTRADRIRAMSDEELAEFLSEAKFYCQRNCEKCLRGTACIPMLQWLKQPVKGE